MAYMVIVKIVLGEVNLNIGKLNIIQDNQSIRMENIEQTDLRKDNFYQYEKKEKIL